MKMIDRSAVALSEEALTAWTEMTKRLKLGLRLIGDNPALVENQEFWLNEADGSLLLKCNTGRANAEMSVPQGHWRWNN